MVNQPLKPPNLKPKTTPASINESAPPSAIRMENLNGSLKEDAVRKKLGLLALSAEKWVFQHVLGASKRIVQRSLGLRTQEQRYLHVVHICNIQLNFMAWKRK